MVKLLLGVQIFILTAFLTITATEESTDKINVHSILSVEINSSINPATKSYLERAYEEADKKNSKLLIIQLNTPGGLVSTTKEIIEMIGTQPIPTVIWIGPEGASATSAGAIIASAAHVLYMAPGTNIGAATPIQMSGDIKQEDLRKKAVNDLVALVKSLSEARGRKTKPFEEMISEAKSFTSKEALKLGIIDNIASNKKEILKDLNGKSVLLQGKKVTLEISDPKIDEAVMDWGQSLLNILANPSMAYVLFIIGAALLYLELQAPGGLIAGSIGVVCLVLAGIGFQVLPLHFGALGLIVLSFVLFVLEAFITSFGLLTLAGLAALITGSMFLFRGNDGYMTISTGLIISTTSAIGVFVLFMVFYLAKQWKQRSHTGFNEIIGHNAEIISISPVESEPYTEYKVKCNGELWKARSTNNYQVGERVKVLSKEEETLVLNI